ncbi:MAG: hypothetical protein WBN64_00905 [Candidatus Deferrimicrobium sp.]
MRQHNAINMFLGGFAAILLLAGCGGGGGGETPQSQGTAPSGSVSVLAWTPPATFNDNVVLDPVRDIEYYEIYVRQDPDFIDSDLPVAQIAAVGDSASADGLTVVRSPVTECTLDSIPSLPAGARLYVSMRAVGVDRQKSAFMDPLAWDRS